jgi:hypothetical protein
VHNELPKDSRKQYVITMFDGAMFRSLLKDSFLLLLLLWSLLLQTIRPKDCLLLRSAPVFATT